MTARSGAQAGYSQKKRGLGFSKEDRDINIRRIGFVASEIVQHGGAVVCAAVSPYRATRNECRSMIGSYRFIEIFVDTPLQVCEERDTKGLYALARAGNIKNFTGIDDPYEPPVNPEIVIGTVRTSAEENAERIFTYLIETKFVLADHDQNEGKQETGFACVSGHATSTHPRVEKA
jgi:sulfate adenylyltransferase